MNTRCWQHGMARLVAVVLCLIAEYAGGVELAAPGLDAARAADGSWQARVTLELPKTLTGVKRVTLSELPFDAVAAEGDLWADSGWKKIAGKATATYEMQLSRDGIARTDIAHRGRPGERYAAFLQAEVEDGEGNQYFSEPKEFICQIMLAPDPEATAAIPLPAGANENEPMQQVKSFARAECVENGARIVQLRGIDCIGAVWSKDGKYAYFVERSNILRKVEAPSMEQKMCMQLPTRTVGFGMSALGLVAWSSDSQTVKVSIYDPETLELIRKVPEFEPAGKAYVSEGSNVMFWVDGQRFVLIDLKGRDEPRVYSQAQLWAELWKTVNRKRAAAGPPPVGVVDAAFSPDGKSFYTIDQGRSVLKHSLSGMVLRAVAISDPDCGIDLEIAPNSKFVTVTGHSASSKGKPAYVFSAANLSQALTEFTGAEGVPNIFIPARRYFGIVAGSKELGSFDGKGQPAGRYSFAQFSRAASLKEIICPRAGKGILVSAGHTWYFVEPGEITPPSTQRFQIGKPMRAQAEAEDGWAQTAVPGFGGAKAWSSDGKTIYCLTERVLRSLSYPALVEQQRLYFESMPDARTASLDRLDPVSYIGETKAGLALNLAGLGEIWIVHPQTFATVRKIAARLEFGESSFVAAASSEFVFVPARDGILAINVATGASETVLPIDQISHPTKGLPLDFASIDLISCRGGSAIIVKTPKRLIRYAVAGSELTMEQAVAIEYGDKVRDWPRPADVLPIPAPWEKQEIDAATAKAANPDYDGSLPGIYLMQATGLSKLLGAYQGNAKIASDPGGKLLYAVSRDLEILAPNGQVTKTFKIRGLKPRTTPIVHPKGGRIVVETAYGIRVIEREDTNGT